ncbi:MAG: type I 3-dehydroquinate dehydratase [Acidobacteria bacterium]|nr:type I 3-dehydroquinate dehydratase [Acidobacteriota bacterium]
MPALPFFIVTLSHTTWEAARACALGLPEGTLPELRLDLFPEGDPFGMVRDLGGHCLVTCRLKEEGGRWEGGEPERQDRLRRALEARPAWLDLEWEASIPDSFRAHLTHVRLLRSVHVPPGIFDLEARLQSLPEGNAWKWVGVARRLADNARLRGPLAWARDRGLLLSAFLMGPKGIVGRAMQGAWGGRFTYAAPDDGPPAAPGQVRLSDMRAWRCHRVRPGHGLCGVLGSPVLHSLGPAFHNPRFQRDLKDLMYLPLDCGDAAEALEAMESLDILGASLTSPLKETVPEALGLPGPLNTLWRARPGDPWSFANTDAEALRILAEDLPRGPVLILGGGGVGRTSAEHFSRLGCPVRVLTRSDPMRAGEVGTFAPVGIVQATRLGMQPGDGLPFPEALEEVGDRAQWGVEWIYGAETSFTRWCRSRGLRMVEGRDLFEAQAETQSQKMIHYCQPA